MTKSTPSVAISPLMLTTGLAAIDARAVSRVQATTLLPTSTAMPLRSAADQPSGTVARPRFESVRGPLQSAAHGAFSFRDNLQVSPGSLGYGALSGDPRNPCLVRLLAEAVGRTFASVTYADRSHRQRVAGPLFPIWQTRQRPPVFRTPRRTLLPAASRSLRRSRKPVIRRASGVADPAQHAAVPGTRASVAALGRRTLWTTARAMDAPSGDVLVVAACARRRRGRRLADDLP